MLISRVLEGVYSRYRERERIAPDRLIRRRRTDGTKAAGVLALCFIGILVTLDSPREFAGTGSLHLGTSARASTLSNRDVCFQAYADRQFVRGMDACKIAGIEYALKLAAMAQDKTPSVVLNSSWDMLRITYVLAFGYRREGKAELAHSSDLHSVGWGLFVLGAIEELDPNLRNSTYAARVSEIGGDFRTLDASFPGAVNEEKKAVEESSR